MNAISGHQVLDWQLVYNQCSSRSAALEPMPGFSNMFLLKIFVVNLCTACNALALASSNYCSFNKETKTAKYDDLPFVEPGPNPIPPHYYGLSYITFQVDQYDGFIPPTSGNQWIMAFGGSGNISIPDR
jgi:hypothetical protein